MSQVFYFQSGNERATFIKEIESKDGKVQYESDWKK